ncbi:flavin-containing monooxygenase [Xylogone sp. PMI_703]|nr:flavin-containing monooxygenase [Xylogone sp. PMI_703]
MMGSVGVEYPVQSHIFLGSEPPHVLLEKASLNELPATKNLPQSDENASSIDTSIPPFERLQGSLPVVNISPDVDHAAIASAAIVQLGHLKEDSFADNVLWRDICALTGTFRTFYGSQRTLSAWRELSQVQQPCGFEPVNGTSQIIRVGDNHSWIQTRYTFECHGSPAIKCSGLIALVPDSEFNSSQWKIWMLTTLLEEIKGFPNPDSMPIQASANGNYPNEHCSGNNDFDCVVVGAGFSGLCLAGRLKALGVRSVALEKYPGIGDNWRNRYESARFHTTKYYSDFPLGRMYSPDDPEFPGRLDLIRTYQKYAEIHGLNVWCSSRLNSASYDQQSELWILNIDREGKSITMKTRHLVFAIGGGGQVPKIPQLCGRETYRGEVLHSIDYKSSHQWKGKAGIIVGSANTAHDVAEDMVHAGLSSVTMIQRHRTSVIPAELYRQWTDTYYNNQTPIELADRLTISLPVAISRQAAMLRYGTPTTKLRAKFDALENSGFSVERSGDLVKHLLGENGGHLIDVGSSAKIIEGSIKIKGNATLTEFTPSGLRFADGSSLDADVIIFCTGFENNMRYEVTKIVGEDIGSRLADYWGIDDEGELRGAYKKLNYPGIWYLGGGAPLARFYSRFLALQIKADIMGCPLHTYTEKL